MDAPRRSRGLVVALGVAAAAAGCDLTDPERSSITQAASLAIANQLMFDALDAGFEVSAVDPGSGTAAAASAAAEAQVQRSRSCSMGGSTSVEGVVVDELSEAGTGSVSFDLTQRPDGCGLETAHGRFVVSGDPSLRLTATVSIIEGEPSGALIGMEGSFRWDGQGGSGTCEMALTWDYDLQEQSESPVSGRMCSYDF